LKPEASWYHFWSLPNDINISLASEPVFL
jgi:hypothetical protein